MPSVFLTNPTCWVIRCDNFHFWIFKKWKNIVPRREGRGVTREGVSVEYWSLWEKVVLLSCIAEKDDENEKEETKFLQLN